MVDEIPRTLADRLAETGNRIAELSKQAASATKEAAGKVAETSKDVAGKVAGTSKDVAGKVAGASKNAAGKVADTSKGVAGKVADAGKGAAGKIADASKEAVAKTTQAVADAKEERREKKEEKLTKLIEDTKAELKEHGHLVEPPAMITLPEFEEERMALMAEEHDILVDLVDQMHALSNRVDQLEKTYAALAHEDKAHIASQQRKVSVSQPAVLRLLFVSVVWVGLLTGLDQALSSSGVLFLSTYPAEIFTWAVGTSLWVVYLVSQIGKAAPAFKPSRSTLIQFGLFTGIISTFLLLLSTDNIGTMSTFYVLGLGITIVVLLTSRLITDESEIIG